jgi:hypothetical protein
MTAGCGLPPSTTRVMWPRSRGRSDCPGSVGDLRPAAGRRIALSSAGP